MSWIDIYLGVNFFIIGTLFGSFFSLANYRIPRKKDIVFTRSFCPKCKHNLGFFDLIPVLSFVFQGGKCRYCRDKISIRYPLLEISSGIMFLLIYILFDLSWYTLIAIAIYIYLVMTTGCYINKKKLINEELNNMNLNKKSGVFITEIIIAAIIFAVTIGASYTTYKNSISNKQQEIMKNRAMFECTKSVEIALGLEYDDLSTFTCKSVIDGITYNTVITVNKYSDSFKNKEDYIKLIEAKTEYMYNGQLFSHTIETVKKKV